MILSVLSFKLRPGVSGFRKKFPAEKAVADVGDAKDAAAESGQGKICRG
jgi:hypothetical protein